VTGVDFSPVGRAAAPAGQAISVVDIGDGPEEAIDTVARARRPV
jgi:hypothetical protein